jgi:hypothetical protein
MMFDMIEIGCLFEPRNLPIQMLHPSIQFRITKSAGRHKHLYLNRYWDGKQRESRNAQQLYKIVVINSWDKQETKGRGDEGTNEEGKHGREAWNQWKGSRDLVEERDKKTGVHTYAV